MGLGDYCHHAESIVPEAVLDDLAELIGNWVVSIRCRYPTSSTERGLNINSRP